MELHHIGCLVENIPEAISEYKKLYSNNLESTNPIKIETQKVSVCFLKIANSVSLELVEPFPDNRTLLKLLKKGTSYYHLGYLTPNFKEESIRLISEGYKKLPDFKSEAFNFCLCAFFVNSLGHLIELIEQPPEGKSL